MEGGQSGTPGDDTAENARINTPTRPKASPEESLFARTPPAQQVACSRSTGGMRAVSHEKRAAGQKRGGYSGRSSNCSLRRWSTRDLERNRVRSQERLVMGNLRQRRCGTNANGHGWTAAAVHDAVGRAPTASGGTAEKRAPGSSRPRFVDSDLVPRLGITPSGRRAGRERKPTARSAVVGPDGRCGLGVSGGYRVPARPGVAGRDRRGRRSPAAPARRWPAAPARRSADCGWRPRTPSRCDRR